MTDRVLVTGASGFIGHHLIQALLEASQQVTCLVRKTSNVSHLPLNDISLVYGELSDPDSLHPSVSEVDTVYHLAGLTTAFNPESLYATNQIGTRNLVQACAASPSPPVFVLLSSLAAAGPSSPERPLVEEDPPRPVSQYGRSKLAGETAAREFAAQVPITIVRAAAVFGEWDLNVLQIYQFIKRGFHLVPTPKDARYSAIHAADLAQILIRSAESGERCHASDGNPALGLYYAAYDLHLTYAELGKLIAASIDRKGMWTIMVPRPLTLLIAGLTELWARLRGEEPGIVNRDKMREFFSESLSCSPRKALDTFGIEFATSLQDRLRQTARWYQEQGFL